MGYRPLERKKTLRDGKSFVRRRRNFLKALPFKFPGISKAEMAVAKKAATGGEEGLPLKRIARDLKISDSQVRDHILALQRRGLGHYSRYDDHYMVDMDEAGLAVDPHKKPRV